MTESNESNPGTEPPPPIDLVGSATTESAATETATASSTAEIPEGPPVMVGESVPPPPQAVQDDIRVIQHPAPVIRVIRDPSPLAPMWLVAAAATAVAADVALRRAPWNNVAGSILIATMAVGLLASGYIRTKTSRVMVLGAIFFGVFIALRTEPILTTFNMLASVSLLILAAIHGQGRSFWDLRPFRVAADGAAVIYESVVGIAEVPSEIGARYRVAKEQAQAKDASTMYAVFRGLAFAIPVVVILGLLLASADAVFQSFFSGFGGINVGVVAGHLALMTIGAYAMMVLIRLGATQGGVEPTERAPSLGHIEALVILISINLLFAAFAVAQLMTILGGAEDALQRAGLQPKQFARQGFFQLLWVAGITLGLLMTLRVVTSGNEKAKNAVRTLSLLTVALTLAIVVVALTRIGFYIEEEGQTALRLYSAIFCIWVGVAFIAVAIRIWGVRPATAWLLPSMVVSGLVVLGLLNIANPEAIIANDNLDRNHGALYWHVVEGQFTGDGQAVLANDIGELSPELAERVTTSLCDQYGGTEYKSGWLDFNLGKWRAENSVPKLCN